MTRILISAGGTGGGVYPALAVARALRRQAPDIGLDFATSVHGIENEMIEKSRSAMDEWYKIQSGPIHGVNIFKKMVSAVRIAIGIVQSFVLLLRTRPDTIFLTGGWVGLPLAFSARLLRIPLTIFVPDIEPGRALKFLGKYSALITATSQETERYFPVSKRVLETGYPLREGLTDSTREAGIQAFRLDSQKRTLLVFGGSRGSRAINNAVLAHAEELLALPDVQILHVSGTLDATDVQAQRDALPGTIRNRYHVFPYIHDFGLALACADLVISRAGASTIGEFPVFGLPSILIPLAYSWRYQEVNADWLASRGAAIRLDEPQMAEELVAKVNELLSNPIHYADMKKNLAAIARRDGADNIAKAILGLAK